MSIKLPTINFKVSRRHVPPTTKQWLKEKTQYFTEEWATKGPKILRSIQKNCGFNFPSKALTEGITVYVHAHKQSDNLGDMDETEPLVCNLYISKKDTWRTTKRTLVHELIHCLMWQKFYYDNRTRKPTLFADIFADELIASIVECMVVGLKPGPKICRDALEYAIDETTNRLPKNGNQQQKLVKFLIEFSEAYRQKVKKHEANILNEREQVLNKLPSLLPETID